MRRSARKGVLRIYGKGDKVREVRIHAKLRPGLGQWLTECTASPGAGTSPALFLNTKGGRLAARAASSPPSPGRPRSTTTRPPMS